MMLPEPVSTLVTWYVAGLLAVLGYAYLNRRLRLATRDMRRALVRDLATRMDAPDADADERHVVTLMLAGLTSGWTPWLLALLLPMFLGLELLHTVRPAGSDGSPKPGLDRDTVFRWGLCVAALSPLAGLLLFVEAVFALLLMRPPREGLAVLRSLRFLDRLVPQSGRVAEA
jgi:hypothetical protein